MAVLMVFKAFHGQASAWPCATASTRHTGPPLTTSGFSACKGLASRARGGVHRRRQREVLLAEIFPDRLAVAVSHAIFYLKFNELDGLPH